MLNFSFNPDKEYTSWQSETQQACFPSEVQFDYSQTCTSSRISAIPGITCLRPSICIPKSITELTEWPSRANSITCVTNTAIASGIFWKNESTNLRRKAYDMQQRCVQRVGNHSSIQPNSQAEVPSPVFFGQQYQRWKASTCRVLGELISFFMQRTLRYWYDGRNGYQLILVEYFRGSRFIIAVAKLERLDTVLPIEERTYPQHVQVRDRDMFPLNQFTSFFCTITSTLTSWS